MSLNAATIEFLLTKGLTGEDLLEVARRQEMRTDPTAAERKRKQRAKEKNGIHVDLSQRDVTRDTGFPNESILTPSGSPSVISDEMTSPVELKPEHVVEAWNDMAVRYGLPIVRKLTPDRRRKLNTRIKQNTIDEFTEAIGAIERSPFLRGENNRGWRADFNWMLEPSNFVKLTEGTYDRQSAH